jgi:hypothetical protein
MYAATVAVLISYFMFAYGRAWVPFRLHPERPFTSTARRCLPPPFEIADKGKENQGSRQQGRRGDRSY